MFKRILSLLVVNILLLGLIALPIRALTPVTPLDPNLIMYANGFTVGEIKSVNFDPYDANAQVSRINPTNALGRFDAVAPAGVSDYFFAIGARTWSHYTFAEDFYNVDGAPDIEFAEVTWGNGTSWHTEAMKVYLTDAYIRDSEGKVVPYGVMDDGIGYYAGIAWNRIGLEYVSDADRLSKTHSYFAGTRDFEHNVFYRSGPYGTYTQFHLPEEVVYAKGIHLVDITHEVYTMAYPSTYINVSGTGALVTLNSDAWNIINYTKITAADVLAVPGTNGNTDGYDLDAIRVYRYIPWRTGDTATGSGTRILPKGTWFMYNYYDGSVGTFDLQAGNPKDGMNVIGTYTVTKDGDMYTINYDIDETIEKNGYIYHIILEDEHLGIRDGMTFKAIPGQDDNHDFGVPFEDVDGMFYIFAHFSVRYE